MKKAKGKKQLLPIVAITFQDHTASTEGGSGPGHFLAVGIVIEETALGYQLGHWLCQDDPADYDKDHNVVSYIAKVKGLKIKTIGHWVDR